MGKVSSMVWLMMIISVIVIEGEQKEEIPCRVYCQQFCNPSVPVSQCADCRRRCPFAAMRARNHDLEIPKNKKENLF
ncbi:hypothetical protein EUTSA_v10023131mg [Eutrema salsugineum]|uniref:4Fe-4S ferredoxin-type domain-containing protein n=1 Tax=Eutrema salsugineum TaxID=72664 RepID=V4MEJ4_EUTSA|nr:hypothetical protein EUTSA_v10023131mg [Eutrema salsugineum]